MARPHRAERVEGVTSCNICSARGRLRGLRGAENPVSAVWKLALGLVFLLKTKDLLGSYGFLGPDSSRGACRHVGGCARVVTFRSEVPRRPRQPPGTLDGPWGPVTGVKIGKVRWIQVVKDRAGVVSVPQPRQIDSRGNTPPAISAVCHSAECGRPLLLHVRIARRRNGFDLAIGVGRLFSRGSLLCRVV